ncbi:MAG: hypothetical protein Q9181_007066, partial [Wetmoreana brouardii]
MIEVDLESCSALAGVVEADAADLAVHPDAPLGEPADEVDARDGETVDGVEGYEEVEAEIEDRLEYGEEGHEGGIDDDFAAS